MHDNARLETFCDGVFAIALTLLIIDVKLPPTAHVETSADLWRALRDLLPTVFAFVLSFAVILVTWVNHHEALKLVHRSSPRFFYANGFMLLTIVVIPFPTTLLGQHLFSDHASPAVVLYAATDALQAVAWGLVSRSALGPKPLTRDDEAARKMRGLGRNGAFALGLYSGCAVTAVWWPLATAAVIAASWCVWLVFSLNHRAA